MASDTIIAAIEADAGKVQSFAFVVCAGVAVCLAVGLTVSSSSGPSCGMPLDTKVNPNDAPVASLVRLPQIGLVRAHTIVAYRRAFTAKNSEMPAFRNCDDLQKVKGIGPKTVQNISKWLKFE
jgi:DNA uptake protein ComE-like DNA-binding protein